MILFFVNIGVLLLLAALCPRPQLGRYRIDAQKLYVVLAMGYLMLQRGQLRQSAQSLVGAPA